MLRRDRPLTPNPETVLAAVARAGGEVLVACGQIVAMTVAPQAPPISRDSPRRA